MLIELSNFPASSCEEPGASAGKIVTVKEVIRSLALHPIKTIAYRWNWKSAVLSTVIRGCVFFLANLVAGLNAALGAMATELVYRGLSSGFLGALTEAFREAEPAWLAGLTVALLLPALGHSVEFAVHWMRRTPELCHSMVGSIGFTAVSTLFNLYAMRRGALIVGEGGGSLLSDLRRMPVLLLDFLALIPRALHRGVKLRTPNSERMAGPDRHHHSTLIG